MIQAFDEFEEDIETIAYIISFPFVEHNSFRNYILDVSQVLVAELPKWFIIMEEIPVNTSMQSVRRLHDLYLGRDEILEDFGRLNAYHTIYSFGSLHTY